MSQRSKPRRSDGQVGSSKLPPEVTTVRDKIGLESGDGVKNIGDKLGEHFDNIKYHAYGIKNVGKKMAKYSMKKKDKTIKKEKKKRKNRLTSKERRELFDVTKSKDLHYSFLIGLNDLWKGYISSVIKSIKSPNDQLKLIRADFHGALFVVSAAKNPALVGIKGIVIQETKNTFRLITQEDRVVTVSKVGTLFAFESEGSIFKLNGTQLSMTPQQRARTKPKVRSKVDMKQDV
jgi:ribonuclease P protein subunit POP4